MWYWALAASAPAGAAVRASLAAVWMATGADVTVPVAIFIGAVLRGMKAPMLSRNRVGKRC